MYIKYIDLTLSTVYCHKNENGTNFLSLLLAIFLFNSLKIKGKLTHENTFIGNGYWQNMMNIGLVGFGDKNE